jgi:hypothetical protein
MMENFYGMIPLALFTAFAIAYVLGHNEYNKQNGFSEEIEKD